MEPLSPMAIRQNEEKKAREIYAIFYPEPPTAPKNEKSAPTKMEAKEPIPVQTTIVELDKNSQVMRSQGANFPQGHFRPQPPTKVKEEGSVIVAKELSGQLGTDPRIKSQQRIDERKMAVLTDSTLASLMHFSYRYVNDGVRYWGHLTEWWLTGSQGIGGLARRHILQAMANSSGIQSVDKAEKPNALARNIWQRDWKEQAEREGKVVE